MNDWIWKKNDNMEFISINSWLQEGVHIAFSARPGGCSTGPYESLNMGLHVGDHPDRVRENRKRLLEVFHAGMEDAICCQQVHGHNVLVVGEADRGKGAVNYIESIPDCDGMITNTPGLTLLSFYADCIPLYFYDPVLRVVAISHAGWKGTMGRIAARTIETMRVRFGSLPSDIKVFIGPGIGPCCFEVGPDLADKVSTEMSDLHGIIYESPKGSFHWDLKASNQQILLSCGICRENLSVCNLCTSCDHHRFFSYRKENGTTGRMAALIGLDDRMR